jgi:hypothetical protein
MAGGRRRRVERAREGDRPRGLVEAVASGNLDSALANVPPGSRSGVADAARTGFLSGINEILMLGGVLSIAGALFALWLIRERDIEREAPIEVEPEYMPAAGEALPEPIAA